MRVWRTLRNTALDLQYGRPLAGTIRTRYGHLGAFHITNSQYEDLPALFAAAELTHDDVVVDVGCGKGRVLNWLLRHHPHNRLVGIELDPDVCARTRHRLRRRPQVTVLCGDATELLPADGTVFYLFNPFDGSVLRRLADTLIERTDDPTRVRVIYYHCRFLEVFKADPRFDVEEITLPSRSQPSALIRVGDAAASPST